MNSKQERKFCKSPVFAMPYHVYPDGLVEFLSEYRKTRDEVENMYNKRDGLVDIWHSPAYPFQHDVTSKHHPFNIPYFGVKNLFDVESWLKHQGKGSYVKESGDENIWDYVDTTSQEAIDKAIQQLHDKNCSVCKKKRENGEEPLLNITNNLTGGTTKQVEQDSYPKQAYYFPDIALDKYDNFDDVIYCYIVGESIYDKDHFIFQYRAECGSVVTEAQPKRRFKMADDDGVEEFFVSLTDNRDDLIEIGGSKLYNTYRKQLIEDLLRQGE